MLKTTPHQINGYNESTASTSGTGEDDLMSIVVVEDTHLAHKITLVDAAGTKTGANNNKTIKFYFGASTVTFHPAANTTTNWKFSAVISHYNNASHRCSWIGYDGTTISAQGYSVFTDNLAPADITIKCTGECADAGDTITQTVFTSYSL
jgi:hypothetical protein